MVLGLGEKPDVPVGVLPMRYVPGGNPPGEVVVATLVPGGDVGVVGVTPKGGI